MNDAPQAPTTKQVKKYKWRGNQKQLTAMHAWLDPASVTFGNAYLSFVNAGFKPSYARNIMSLTPNWLSEYIDRMDLEPVHIKQGIQQLAVAAPNSRSPDDTRLKAYETLAKIAGMIDNKNSNTTVNIVQPILAGASTPVIKEPIIDVAP